jgi:LuxR family transcriptional regulator, maltose regulon positive regulatory protein
MFRQSPVVPPMTRRSAAPSKLDDPARGDDVAPPKRGRAVAPRRLPPVELGPIIKSKIQPPALRTSTLSRQRLIGRLADATTHRLTLLIAEAGYGKTTLLADFARASAQRTLWYRLDPTDGDVITWANHIIAAAREAEPEFGDSTLRLMSQLATGGPPTSAFVSSVISELGGMEPVPTLLVLDDFHAVDESDEAVEFVSRLTRDAPPWLRLIVSSRRKPALGLGRLTASDELAEITTDDLRFSREETIQLFAESYGTPLDDDVLADLDSRTKGWVASLQLFHGSIRGRSPSAARALARQLSGASSPIYDFLAEEVLANLPPHLERFLLRSSLLERITSGLVVALFADLTAPPTAKHAAEWIDEADRLTLLSRSSQTSDARQLHPLLRDFLIGQLRDTELAEAIREMHVRVAQLVADHDPLTAAHHYIEAGDEAAAMKCVGASALLTMGTGQAGTASDLVDRMRGALTDPAVAALRARRLLEQGDLLTATELLGKVDITTSPSEVRAIVRHTNLALWWRTGDRELMFETLREIQNDPDAPAVLADIFQIYLDASPLSLRPVPYAVLATRMERMSHSQGDSGQTYYVAISLHNAAQTMLAAGRYDEAVRLGHEALIAFDAIPHVDVEKYSTHTVLAIAAFELDDSVTGEMHLRKALSSGLERGEVHSECAFALAVLGDTNRATQLLLSAAELEAVGRSDLAGQLLHTFAQSLMAMPDSPDEARRWLHGTPDSMPLDTGYVLDRQTLIALSYVLSGELGAAREVAEDALEVARARGARRALARLEILLAIAMGNADGIRKAITAASEAGELALLTVADAVASALWLVPEIPTELRQSIGRWPARWLPSLRRQLNSGGTPNAAVAARLLDEFGESSDLTRLKAFAKAYRKVTRTIPALGTRLARRVAPTLEVADLGRTRFSVGDRVIDIGAIRRKSSGLLMFLATRPGFAANREQTLEELWPETDPESASNNLNQSLFFLRREIDPWYEDELSVEYVGFQGDLVWLDPNLTRVASVEFAAHARTAIARTPDPAEAFGIMSEYSGQFSPEFEYEEWAISWRARVHALFLELASTSIRSAVTEGELAAARDLALLGLDRDPAAFDLERKLVWLYWRMGSHSAAVAQHEHLASSDERDGLDVVPLSEIVEGGLP